MKLLISSAGSLVAHNLFSALGPRREALTIVGCNSVADSPIAFACDRLYHVSPTASPAFADEIAQILSQEQPDVILPGRDRDVLFWAEFAERHPVWAPRIPVGSRAMAAILFDKAATWRFAQAHHLPMAHTLPCGKGATEAKLNALIAEAGWPLIAKPIEGFGSHGVRLLAHRDEALFFLGQSDWLLQAYLRAPEEAPILDRAPLPGIPLLPELAPWSQYSAQVIIDPTGTVTDLFTCQHHMALGRWQRLTQVNHSDLNHLAQQVSTCIAQAGWRGPLNIEAKPDARGRWQIIECNARLTGATSARRRLGHDEIGRLFRHYAPHLNLPLWEDSPEGEIYHLPEERTLPLSWVETLRRTGVWESA
ncbi:MAG: hypothetical protein ACO1RX_02595 [Candidatus Sericytochromatia bacterium]